MKDITIGVDPQVEHPAVCIYQNDKVKFAAEVPIRNIEKTLRRELDTLLYDRVYAFIEKPCAYKREKKVKKWKQNAVSKDWKYEDSKEDSYDFHALISQGISVGEIKAQLYHIADVIEIPEPQKWYYITGGHWTNMTKARKEHSLAYCNNTLKFVTNNHNVADAVCIACYGQGRANVIKINNQLKANK